MRRSEREVSDLLFLEVCPPESVPGIYIRFEDTKLDVSPKKYLNFSFIYLTLLPVNWMSVPKLVMSAE